MFVRIAKEKAILSYLTRRHCRTTFANNHSQLTNSCRHLTSSSIDRKRVQEDGIVDPGRDILPTSHLLFDIFFYGYCCHSTLLTNTLPTLAFKYPIFRQYVVEPIFKYFIFSKFAGGETFDHCMDTAQRLQKQWSIPHAPSSTSNLSFIIDEAAEDLVGENAFDIALQGKLSLLSSIKTHKDDKSNNSNDERKPVVKFVPLKCSSLLPGESLEILTSLINERDSNSIKVFSKPNMINEESLLQEASNWWGNNVQHMSEIIDLADDVYIARNNTNHTSNSSGNIHSENRSGPLRKGLQRLQHILQDAQDKGIRILLDAEQSNRQPALDLLYRYLAYHHCTTNTIGAFPVLYNTYQCYLTRSEQALMRDYVFCRNNNLNFAVKLVRGAYLRTETDSDSDKYRNKNGDTSNNNSNNMTHRPVIWPSKSMVDDNYNTLALRLLDYIRDTHSNSSTAGRVSVLYATHNRASVRHITQALSNPVADRNNTNNSKSRNHHLAQNNHPDIHFAQILGMADLLTISLLTMGRSLPAIHYHSSTHGGNNNISTNDNDTTNVDGDFDTKKTDTGTTSPVAGTTGGVSVSVNVSKLLLYGEVSVLLPWLLRRLQENQDGFGAMQQEVQLLKQLLYRRLFVIRSSA